MLKVLPATVVVVVVSVAVVSVAVVVVESLPPQAASDSAIIEMPPAFAAFLAFLVSQAFTSLLVALSAPEGGISAFYCNWLMPQNEQ
jgi:hypothetical protein